MSLSISSDFVRFIDIVNKPIQEFKLRVQNTSQRPLRVRVTQPSLDYFRVDFNNQVLLAPGSSQVATVKMQCQGKNSGELQDEFIVAADSDKMQVKLEAVENFSQLVCKTGELDFGAIPLGTEKELSFELQNLGISGARYSLECSQLSGYQQKKLDRQNSADDLQKIAEEITVSPTRGDLAANEKTQIKVKVHPATEGAYHYMLKITQVDKITEQISVQVTVLAVKQVLVVQANDLSFDAIYMAEQTKKLTLTNPCPFPVSYQISTAVNELDGITVENPEEKLQKITMVKDLFFVIDQDAGVLQPLESVEVSVAFRPRLELKRADHVNRFMTATGLEQWQRIIQTIDKKADPCDYSVFDQFTDEQLCKFGTEFRCFRPQLDDLSARGEFLINIADEAIISKQFFAKSRRPLFVFGGTENLCFDKNGVNVRELEAKNMSCYPATLKISCPVSFHLDRENGPRVRSIVFAPKEAKVLTVVYQPKSLNEMDDFLHFDMENEYFNANLTLKIKRMLDPKKILYNATAKIDSFNGTKKVVPQELQQTTTLKQYVDEGIKQDAGCDRQYNDLKLTKANYQQQYVAKTEKEVNSDQENSQNLKLDQMPTKVTAFNDCLDLGLDNLYDQAEFQLEKPDFRYKNKTIEVIDQNQQLINTVTAPQKRPTLNNDSSPTSKLYPASLYESHQLTKIAEECKARIPQRQLNIISTGDLTFDFNQITVGTKALKYFKIANDLSQYIKIELVPHEHLDKDTGIVFDIQPSPQYLPPGCFTSFAVSCSFTEIDNKCEDQIDILINDAFFNTLNIKAVVLRPQLSLNFKSFSEILAEETLQKIVKVLQNPRQDDEQRNQALSECMFFDLNSTNAFEKVLQKQLTLSNIGTSECSCTLGFRSQCTDMQISQSQFDIRSGHHQVINIIWTPQTEELSTNMLVISFEKGNSYFVPIVSRLIAGKATIPEKQLDIGLVNVSQTSQLSFTLQNKSTSKPLYYEVMLEQFVETCNQLELEFDHERGEVRPDEPFIVSFSATARKIGPFMTKLRIKIIGGDELSIPIKGIIEAPYVCVRQCKQLNVSRENSLAKERDQSKSENREKSGSVTRRGDTSGRAQQTDNIKFDNQFTRLDQKLTANIPHMIKFELQNDGRVNADLFVDARAAQDIELIDSGEELVSGGIIIQYLTADEMKNKISIFQQDSQIKSPTAKSGQKQVGTTIDKQLDDLSRKYGIPIYKDQSKYLESTTNLMNGQNINELYGNFIVREKQNIVLESSKHENNKIVFIHIPPGQSAKIAFCITTTDVVKEKLQNVFFYLVGIHGIKDIKTLEYRDAAVPENLSNLLQIQYASIQSVLQLSANKINFGVKVADSNYKQISLKYPIQNGELFDKIQQQDTSTLFMDFAANSGLFYQDLTMVNLVNQKVRYAINVVDYDDVIQTDKVYMVSQPFGLLLPYDTIQIRVYCSPVKVGIQSAILKIYYIPVVEGDTTTDFFVNSNYLKNQVVTIQLYAVAVFKALAFSQSPAIFPNTPVGVPSRLLLYINNVGYKNNTKLQIFFPPELSKTTFMAIWPWGNTINHMIKQLPLIITFYSDIPMSFQTKISVLDSQNVPYDLQIAGNCFASSFNLQEFIRYNSSRLKYLDESGKLGLVPQIPSESGTFFTVNQLGKYLDNPNVLREYGITKSSILSLQSINAKPVLSFSDYAVAQKLDSVFYDNIKQFQWDYLTEIPPQDDSKKKHQLQVTKMINPTVQVMKMILNGPFSSSAHVQYPSCIHRLRFIWQLQFKQILSSEAPLTPFLPYFPDIVKFDAADNIRLNFMLSLSGTFLGQKSLSGNFPLQMAQVLNKTSPFLVWVCNMFKSQFVYNIKQMQAIPLQESTRSDFLVQAYDAFLNILKIHGAMLNNVHPALLISKQDFVVYCKTFVAVQAHNAFTLPEEINTQAHKLLKSSSQQRGKSAVAPVQEVNLHSPIISQTSSLLLLDLFRVLHDTFHASAWFHVQTELMRLYIINQVSNPQIFTDSVTSFMRWQLGEASEFKLDRGIGGVCEKSKTQQFQADYSKFSKAVNSPSKDISQSQRFCNKISSNPETIMLDFVRYYSNFQLYGHPLFDKCGFQNIISFDQLFSGFEIGSLILCFQPQYKNLRGKLEDCLAISQKIIDLKVSADQTDFTLNDILVMKQKPVIIGEKLFVSLDSARQSLWKEIFSFVKEQLNILLPDSSLYYFAGGATYPEQMINSLSHNHKLLVAILLQFLPGYIPTRTLNIDLNVASSVTQQLEVAGQKSIVKYNCIVSYPFSNNSCDVQLSVPQLFIEAKQTQTIDITVTSKYLKQCLAFLQFLPIQDVFTPDQIQIPSTMAVLVNVIDSGSRSITTIEAKCGQIQKLAIPVENKAAVEAKFSIQLTEKFYPIDPSKPIKSDVKPGKSILAYKAVDKKLNVGKNSNGTLNINFNPTHPGLYVCQVVLGDDNVGLKNFEIRGFSVLPDPVGHFNLVAQIIESKVFYISNQDLDLVEKLQNADSVRFALLSVGHQNPMAIQYNSKDQRFAITFTPRVKTTPDTFSYKLVILLDQLTKTYDINLTVLKKPEEQKITLQCAALKTQEQVIEIVNSQPDECEFGVTVQTPNQTFFLLNNAQNLDIKVKVAGNSQVNAVLNFIPKWICETQAKVVVRQLLHGITISEYTIVCTATQPDKMQTININGTVEEPSFFKLDIPNNTQQQEQFFVVFDTGDSVFSVVEETPINILPRQSKQVTLKASSFVSGLFQSKLLLQRLDQTYIWYEIKFLVAPRDCSGVLSSKTKAGEKASIKIELQNPINDKSCQFQVEITGIPLHFLKYTQLFQVPAASVGQYEFEFTPYSLGQWQGKIRFFSESVGEYWYELEFACLEVPIKQLTFESVIGEGISQVVQVLNPIPNIQLTYIMELTNTEAFLCDPKRSFMLDSGESGDLKFIYRPTKIGEKESCLVNLVGKDGSGTIFTQSRFSLDGTGTLQYERPVIKIYAQLNQGTSGHISFKNPFLTRASIKFEYDNIPELQFQAKEMLLEPSQEIHIKYIFIPKKLATVDCVLHILVNPNYDLDGAESFSFDYLFEGVGEYTHRTPLAYLQTPARQQIAKVVKLPTEIQIEDYDAITFDIECEIPAVSAFEDTASAVKKSLSIEWTSAGTTSSTQISQPLLAPGKRALYITFNPLKPFACDVMLVLCAEEGGRYKLPIQLFSNQPKSEGSILVELPNGSTSGEYLLKHTNVLNVYSEYRAYFTPNSSERFSVAPASGILEPSQQTGIATMQSGKATELIITCQVGNNNARGQLVVETKDIMFIWDIVSGYKKYIPPTGVAKIIPSGRK